MGRTVFKTTEFKSELLTFKERTRKGVSFEETDSTFMVEYSDDYPEMGHNINKLKPGDKIIIQYYTFKTNHYIIDFIKL